MTKLLLLQLMLLVGIVAKNNATSRNVHNCSGEADVVLLLDRSGSVGDEDYPFLIGFALHLADTFNISENGVRLGVASYATRAKRESNLDVFGFNNFEERAKEFVRGDEDLTNIEAGLIVAREMLSDYSRGARGNATKLIVVTNDGPGNRGNPPQAEADKIHTVNISVISIGIEKDVAPPSKNNESASLASSPELYYFVPKYTSLIDDTFLEKVTKSLCEVVTTNTPKVDKIETTIHEDTAIGTHIYTIPLSSGDINMPVFTLQSSNVPFSVAASDGKITTTATFDYELIQKYEFIVRVTDTNLPGYVNDVELTIFIEDVNDNAPAAETVAYLIRILEDTVYQPPTNILNVDVKDADSGANGKLLFHIKSGNEEEKFFLDNSGQLFVIAELDRETISEYVLIAYASDNGTTPKVSADIKITVIILDVNDSPPFFSQSEVNLEFPENQALGKLYQVLASDVDDGVNSLIKYSIISGNGDVKFNIGQNNGYLTLMSSFDFEVKTSYNLSIKAEDSGVNSLSVHLTINIVILNVDEPLTINGPYSNQIPENTVTGSSVLIVTASDPDGEVITFSLIGQSPFSIGSTSGIVGLVGTIDRESSKYIYELTVTATAGIHNVSTTVTITVTDVNDNKPKFTQSLYTASISEDAAKDDALTTDELIVASDSDATSLNNKITFQLVGHGDAFKVDSESGVITVNNPAVIDYEKAKSYNLLLIATDIGSFAGFATVFVSVENVNDNSPVFNSETYTEVISEDTEPGKEVLQVQATDVDGEQLIYSIPVGLPFNINTATGQIFVSQALDIEVREIYGFQVTVNDGLHNVMSSVQILLTDINDNPPTFLVNGPYEYSVNEDEDIGYLVATLAAQDKDKTSPNNDFKIIITSGNTGNAFAINATSGKLTVVATLDANNINEYNLKIRVKDEGIVPGSLQTEVDVKITIILVNVHAPKILGGPFTVNIDENIANPDIITLQVEDNDVDETLIFSLINNNNIFDIDSSGKITAKQAFDAEGQFMFTITARVTDRGGLYHETVIIVYINDLNDIAPEFVTGGTFFPPLREDTAVGTILGTYQAKDLDRTSPNNVVRYSINGGSGASFFEIDEITGSLTLIKELDFEKKTGYAVRMHATDQGKPSLHAATTVEIEVINVNEHAPVFNLDNYVKDVLETRPDGFAVLTVTATDADAGATITYSVPNGLPFSINSNGGLILKSLVPGALPLDHEMQQQYYFNITATDDGGKSSMSSITINVIDVNDNAPTFTAPDQSINIPEDQVIDAVIASVTAADADSGFNGMVTYEIIDGNIGEKFSIDKDNGKIKLIVSLNYEAREEYVLTIRASDKGEPKKFTTTETHAKVRITVTDVNEKPVFPGLSHDKEISEDESISTPVLLITANDQDSGSNGMIEYSIVSGNIANKFSINPISGLVTLKNTLNFEDIATYVITIRAADKGTPPLDTNGYDATLTITVKDVNEKPVFDPVNYSKTIAELTGVGTETVNVNATDPDNGVAGMIAYSIILGDDNGDFSIEKNTGKISIAKLLNFNIKNTYTLTVRATDEGSPVLDSSPKDATVTIYLIDDNNNAPVFSPKDYMETVSESAVINNFILRVTATDADTGSNAEIMYSIVGGNTNNTFDIDPETGSIKLAHKLDFETTTGYTLTIAATDKGEPALRSNPNAIVIIKVSNVNEHAPVITNLPSIVNILEEQDAAFNLFNVTATDKDAGSKITFSSSDPLFLIESSTGMIITGEPLDRENTASYSVTIKASDGQLFDEEILTVIVVDVNDNTPVFDTTNIQVAIPEDMNVNAVIVSMNATDDDIGINSILVYTIENGNKDEKFKVDQTTGVISLRNAVDFETMQNYTLTVRVSDKGKKPRSAEAIVIITVIDVNDNHPVFDAVSEITLAEDVAPIEVVTVHATDADSGDNGKVIYTFISGNVDGKFSLDMNTGKVSLIGELNFEDVEQYNLVIRATDKGMPALTSEPNDVVVVIKVTDVNDNDPVLVPKDYMKTISEGSPIGTVVVIVTARDEDSGGNGKFMFMVESGNEEGKFHIDMNTGIITVVDTLDRETTVSYSIKIRVTDKGENPRSTFGNVVIKISDENDNNPTFDQESYRESIYENAITGTHVVNVTATDADIGNNGKIMFRIASGGDGKFGIDMETGKIFLIDSLDYEQVQQYTLSIEATDKGSTPLSSSVTVVIDVLDINDNSPVFDPKMYLVSILESSEVGYHLVTVTATDADSGTNAEIMYSIVGGNEENKFYIDMTTGLISLNNQVDFETQTMYTLIIRATDKGKPPKHSELDATLTITVTNANDHAPVIQHEPYNPSLVENVSVGTTVTTITATDTDGDKIEYSFSSPNTHFSIDKDSGVITTKAAIDREINTKFTFFVKASDGENTDETMVMVKIDDENDNAPVVGDISKSFPENHPVNTTLVIVVGSDQDAGLNGKVVYQITAGNEDGRFGIDMENGNIKLLVAFDFEKTKSYTLTITTSDKGTPLTSATSKVDIIVTDVNDNAPVCGDITVSVPEDRQPPSGVVTTVVATDADSGSNGELMFEITSGGNGKFAIDGSGMITIAETIDFETKKKYTLTIPVTDKGNPQQSSTCFIMINVLDVNDNHPKFDPNIYTQSILETIVTGTIVDTVKATDADSNLNADLTFSIVSGNEDATLDGVDDFVINPITGEISTASPLDASTPKYILEISATDAGSPKRTSQVNAVVTIMVLNVNIPPYYTNSPFDTSIPENTPLNSFVTTITAVDDDGDSLLFTLETTGVPFSIDSVSGKLYVTGPLDREIKSQYILTVNVNDGEANVGSTFTITILDINDNAPVFNQLSYKKTLREDFATTEVILTVETTDTDHDVNAEVMYTISSGNEEKKFEIHMTSGEISLVQSLDYEVTSIYTLVITATDKGTSPLSADINVYIYVTDANDNYPVFESDQYTKTFPESVSIGTECVTVVATDEDEEQNGAIMYRIVSGNEENIFAINMTTGVIKFIDSVDYESVKEYTLTVEASDKGDQPKSATTSVKVFITDINDNAPVFNPLIYVKSVSESERVDFVVETVKATDADSGSNGMIVFGIIAGNEEDKFEIGDATGIIRLKNTLDFEQITLYTLTVRATDKGSPSKYSSPDATVTVYVTNSNDNSPVIEDEPYNPDVTENVAEGTTAATIISSDPDGDDLKYSITTLNVPFIIDEITGNITTNGSIDREEKAIYTFTVVVTDGKNADETVVTITILDENDNAPVVPDIIENVSEEKPEQSVIAIVKATDKDIGQNKEVMYEIIGGNNDDVFSINMVTGEIILTTKVDFEITPSYELTIKTTDKGESPQSTTSKVIINVQDENDNKPVSENQTVSIPEDTKEGGTVAVVNSTDRDSGKNGEVMYQITNGGSDHFAIDMTTGEISVIKELDYESVQQYVLSITITDKGSPSQSTTVTVTVDIEDVNDNKPNFNPANYMQTILETTDENTIVETVLAADADSGTNAMIVYAIVRGNLDATNDGVKDFEIDQSTGEIKVVSKLDATTPKYVLEISATDKGSTPLTSIPSAIITIMITNVNIPPKFINTPYDKEISESTQVGTVVQIAEATDLDNQPLVFEILSLNEPFTINSATGEISVSTPLDREKVDSHTITVSVTDGEATVTTNVIFTLKDFNDNAPVFKQPSYKRTLPENTLPDEVVVTVVAEDDDIGDNRDLMYSIDGGNEEGKFEIDMIKGEIKLIRALDFETTSSYTLYVKAQDKGTPAQSTQIKVYVTVTDVNDNRPVFRPATYRKTFSEETAVGTIVVTVTATDADSTSNAEIRYEIISGNEQDKFEIDMGSGEIKFKNTVDFEQQPEYVLIIKATDKGDPTKSSSPHATVTITITDYNDNAPVFNPTLYEKSVSESEEIDFVIDTVKATDKDSGSNGMIEFSITAGNEDEKFKIDPVKGKISLKNTLDFESVTSYSLTIRATDKGNPTEHSNPDATVLITVTNSNDNGPIIQNKPYNPDVDENVSVGTVVTSIVANDTDGDSLTYTLITTDVPFTINTTTGVISTNGAIDREDKDLYVLTVIVSDGKNTDEVTITITVNDENDNAPKCVDVSLTIPEDKKPDNLITTVQATDEDICVNAQLMYEITGGEKNAFTMNETTGTILLDEALDFELQSISELTVTVTDNGIPALSTSCAVIIRISDVNDNKPTADNITVSIPEDTALGGSVAEVIASDKDSGVNMQLMFTITKGNTDELFSIDMATGQITVKNLLDYETKKQHVLTVTVSDKGVPPLSTSVVVTVNVLDVNDNDPKFVHENYEQKIPETTPLGTVVVSVSATDADSGDNGLVKYEIIGGNLDATGDNITDFAIDKNGNIAVASQLDATTPTYVLEVRATDTGGRQSSSNALVTITVTNVNVPPKFTNEPFDEIVSEGVSISTTIKVITATDPDGDTLSYSLLTTGVPFQIDQATGVLSTTGKLDRELQSSYTLTVSVNDGTMAVTTTLVIKVSDENDNSPKFLNPSYEKLLAENALKNQIILTVEATDHDQGENANIMYTISSGNEEGKFEIDMTTGMIELINDLDYEKTTQYSLIVTATDKGIPQLSTDVEVKIYVVDINDNNPIFDPIMYQVTLSESVATDVNVTRVIATDADSGRNGEIVYSFASGDISKFKINMITGVVTVKANLDYEEKIAYTLTVRAADKGQPARHSNTDAIIKITVTDENDNAPEFEEPSYVVNIPETTPNGTVVVTVKATDKDSGLNGMVMYSINDGGDSCDFSINMMTGEISVAEKLDVTEANMYIFTVTATDKGNPSLSADVTVKITVDDVNQPPVISPAAPVEILDNTPIDTVVVHVTASDPDIGSNGEIMFELINVNTEFSIDMNDGKVAVNTDLTSLNIKQYVLQVKVSDKGSPSLSDMQYFVINVIPSNHPPTIILPNLITVRESVAVGYHVTNVVASDSDSGDNGVIMFAITNGDPNGDFSIDMDTGIITLAKKLNAAFQTSYTLLVTVTDKGKPTLSTSGIIHVTVQPISKPEFKNLPFEFCIEENLPAGSHVFTAIAVDKGDDQLTFSIEPASAPFKINVTTGEVKTTAPFDRENEEKYNFEVKVSDGTFVLSTAASICVKDENDNPPIVAEPEVGLLCENAAMGTAVMGITASDSDEDNVLTYSLSGTDSNFPFSIDENGRITLTGDIDFESKEHYTFDVIVSDGKHGTVVHARINICNINEHRPVFNPIRYNVTISSGSASSTELTTVMATDNDTGLAGKIMYRIISGNTNLFKIDSSTGKVSVKNLMYVNSVTTYMLTIKATDEGVSPLSSSLNAEVTIIVKNDPLCQCNFETVEYPCLKWTLENIKERFSGKSISEKLGKALIYIGKKLDTLWTFKQTFAECSNEIKTHVKECKKQYPVTQLLKGFCQCNKHISTIQTLYKSLQKKNASIETELEWYRNPKRCECFCNWKCASGHGNLKSLHTGCHCRKGDYSECNCNCATTHAPTTKITTRRRTRSRTTTRAPTTKSTTHRSTRRSS